MDADWITSPSARRVHQHADDPRPAWLWSQDGQTLIWSNPAAKLFLAKIKKHGLKLAQPAVPIKGQVSRNIRLGSPGRTSLARIQFLAGDKPASATCATTPLVWQDGQTVLLIVAVDPIADDVLAEAAPHSSDEEAPARAVEEPSSPPIDTPEPHENAQDDLAAWSAAAEPASETNAEPDAAQEAPTQIETLIARDDAAYAHELESWREAEQSGLSPIPEDGSIADDSAGTVPEPADDVETSSDTQSEPQLEASPPVSTGSRLSALLDRLAADEALYTPLTAEDDHPPVVPPVEASVTGSEAQAEDAEPDVAESTGQDETGELPVNTPEDDDGENASTTAAESTALFRVTGQGFRRLELPGDESPTAADRDLLAAPSAEDNADEVADLARLDGDDTPVPDLSAPDAEVALPSEDVLGVAGNPSLDTEVVERVSRYNFDELSRILNDRVADIGMPVAAATPPAAASASTSLVNLGGETLVLNRLPLGILVFRDQQILFANRAITDMIGYGSVEELRSAGLASVFPAAGPDGQGAGPVNHLVQRDGTLVPVTARLQSMSWQGRPALMLSASATEVRTGHEAAVNAFAQSLADIVGDGFFEATRNGVIKTMTPKAASMLMQTGPLEGQALTSLINADDVPVLRAFLDRPARFAETERPWLAVRGAAGSAKITLFAQGQAGVVTGYFGFVRARTTAPARVSAVPDADPALLGRISRGVRRPLNTIIGFADMLHAAGPDIDADKLAEYARDISHAGQDIAALVDELEDYARLRDGRYLPQRATIELTELLEGCVVRIRQHASNARVLVRNAISETLPRLTADRASLEQAVLNLLASAIDQTPAGGAVVISAQRMDDGGIAVHVRDSSNHTVDMGERFVVFRDGVGRDGQALAPVRSSVGLALTRSLLAVNAFSLSVDPAGEQGMLFTLTIPADLVATADEAAPQA